MESLFVPISLVAGGLLAVQAGANTRLSKASGSPFAATTLQLTVAALILLVVATLTGSLTALGSLRGVPWWHAVGGVASAAYVVSTILLFPRLGAIVTVGLLIAGQMLASLALDAFGLLGIPIKDVDTGMLLGTLAVVAGAIAIVMGQEGAGAELTASKLGWIGLALAAGVILPVQGAVNALLRADIGAPFMVGTISFVVATMSMAAVFGLVLLVSGVAVPRLGDLATMPAWGWLGGFAGATYVMTMFTAIPAIGTAAAVGLTIAGQQVASVLVDRYGWFQLPRRPVLKLRLAGVVLLLVGVAAILLP